jgi:hypothetical protein
VSTFAKQTVMAALTVNATRIAFKQATVNSNNVARNRRNQKTVVAKRSHGQQPAVSVSAYATLAGSSTTRARAVDGSVRWTPSPNWNVLAW